VATEKEGKEKLFLRERKNSKPICNPNHVLLTKSRGRGANDEHKMSSSFFILLGPFPWGRRGCTPKEESALRSKIFQLFLWGKGSVHHIMRLFTEKEAAPRRIPRGGEEKTKLNRGGGKESREVRKKRWDTRGKGMGGDRDLLSLKRRGCVGGKTCPEKTAVMNDVRKRQNRGGSDSLDFKDRFTAVGERG